MTDSAYIVELDITYIRKTWLAGSASFVLNDK